MYVRYIHIDDVPLLRKLPIRYTYLQFSCTCYACRKREWQNSSVNNEVNM